MKIRDLTDEQLVFAAEKFLLTNQPQLAIKTYCHARSSIANPIQREIYKLRMNYVIEALELSNFSTVIDDEFLNMEFDTYQYFEWEQAYG